MQAREVAGRAATKARLAGDEEELFRRHHAQLVRTVQRRVGVPRDVAEDAVALAWVQLIRCQPDREHIGGWLFTVAKHECFHLYRQAERATPTAADGAPPEPEAPVSTTELVERYERLRTGAGALRALKPQERRAIRLKAQGYSYREITELTGWTYTKVNRCLTEGRRALRQLLAEAEG